MKRITHVDQCKWWHIFKTLDLRLIVRWLREPTVSFIICKKFIVVWYLDDDTVGVATIGTLKPIERVKVVLALRKLINLFGKSYIVWTSSCDQRTKRLVRLLGFGQIGGIPSYNKYIWQLQQ